MSKRSKRNKQQRRRRRPEGQRVTGAGEIRSVGFDYGCLPNVMGVGMYEFPNYLHDANVVGMAYGMDYSTELERPIPCISLVVRNEAPVRRAFDTFHAWAAGSDADALDVAFVFREDGGYLVVLSP